MSAWQGRLEHLSDEVKAFAGFFCMSKAIDFVFGGFSST